LCLTLAAFLALPTGVLADAQLIEAVPAPGAALDAPPAAVILTFDEELDPDRSSVEVRYGSGVVARGGVDPDDSTVLTVALPDLEPGTYEVRWTAGSSDGHLIRDRYEFTITAAPTPAPTPSPTRRPTPAPTASQVSAGPTASATSSPSPIPSPAPTAPPSPAPSSLEPSPSPSGVVVPTTAASSSADVLVPLTALALMAIGVAVYFLRTRRA
jgi:methionine-rich copper-binding protein CopC